MRLPALLLTIVFFAAPNAFAAKVLRVATEGNFRPFNAVEGKTFTGFEVDLVNAIAKKLGMKTEWTSQPFDSLLADLARHRFDLVAASHAITPERTRLVEFINPHYCSGAMIVTRTGGPRSLRDLSGQVIGVEKGTTYFDRLKAMPRFKEIKTYADGAAASSALASGEIAAWVTDRFAAGSVLKARTDTKLDFGDVLFPEMIAMAVAKDNAALKDKINGALTALMQDGTYLRLSQQYFKQDIRCRDLKHKAHSALTN